MNSYGDRAYDHAKYRKKMRAKGIRPRIARRDQPHGSGLGRDDIHETFLGLATCIITWRHITRLC